MNKLADWSGAGGVMGTKQRPARQIRVRWPGRPPAYTAIYARTGAPRIIAGTRHLSAATGPNWALIFSDTLLENLIGLRPTLNHSTVH